MSVPNSEEPDDVASADDASDADRLSAPPSADRNPLSDPSHPYHEFYALPDADRLSQAKDKPKPRRPLPTPPQPTAARKRHEPRVTLNKPGTADEGDVFASMAPQAAKAAKLRGEGKTKKVKRKSDKDGNKSGSRRKLAIAGAVAGALVIGLVVWQAASGDDAPPRDEGISGFPSAEPTTTPTNRPKPSSSDSETEAIYGDAINRVVAAADLNSLRAAGKKAGASIPKFEAAAQKMNPSRALKSLFAAESKSLSAMAALADLPDDPVTEFATVATRLKDTASVVAATRKELSREEQPSDPTKPAEATFHTVDTIGLVIINTMAQKVVAQIAALGKVKTLAEIVVIGNQADDMVTDAQALVAGFVVKSVNAPKAKLILQLVTSFSALADLTADNLDARWPAIAASIQKALVSVPVPEAAAIMKNLGTVVGTEGNLAELKAYALSMTPLFKSYGPAFISVPNISGQQKATVTVRDAFVKSIGPLSGITNALANVEVPTSMAQAHQAVVDLMTSALTAANSGTQAARGSFSCRSEGRECFLASQSSWESYLGAIRRGARGAEVGQRWTEAFLRVSKVKPAA